jgi:protein-disulfide isomerase
MDGGLTKLAPSRKGRTGTVPEIAMGVISRLVLACAFMVSLAACSKGGGASSDDMSLGSPDAKVTVQEYASVACPHCAAWNNEIFPDFKKKYIDTGKVKYVLKEALTGNPTLATSGFLLARCAGKDKYFFVTDAVYRAQDQLYEPNSENVRQGEARDILLHIAESAGLTEDQFNKCLSDQKALQALDDRIEKSMQQDGVESTPTFIVNGKKMEAGDKTLAQLDAVIQPLLK